MKQLLFLSLLFLPLVGCNGSGAVNPLSPVNAAKQDVGASTDSDVIYWSNFPLANPVADSINAICLINKKLGWACGNNGLVLQYDGQTWNKVNVGLGQNENFMAVGFLNETEGWIAGTHGIILHYNNGQWTQDSSPSTEVMYGIAVTRSRNVWLVGSNATILTYNGISWGAVTAVGTAATGSTTITDDIYSISLSDRNSGWAVGNRGLILKYDGQKWQSFVSPSTERLNSVSALSDVQAWADGAYGTILNFNGTTWSKMGNAFSGFDLYSIAMKDDSDGWISGQDGTIAFYDGTRWISHVKPEGKPSLNAMAFYKDIGFMVGQNGTIMKFQLGGTPTKYDFNFKGAISETKPSKLKPYWSITYTMINQSPKATDILNFVLPLPKGFEPYVLKATPTPQGGFESAPVAPAISPTPIVTVTTGTPSAKPTVRPVTGPTTGWKVKDGNWTVEIGSMTSTETKRVTILLASKKDEKKEYPVVLNASLRTVDRTIADAFPVTLFATEPKPETAADLTPVTTPTTNSATGSNNLKGATGVQPTATLSN